MTMLTLLEMLLEAGAEVNTRAKGVNAVMLAREKGHMDIERLLLERGAKPELNFVERKCKLS